MTASVNESSASSSYWQQTGIRVGAGLGRAVLLVAGTLVYLHLFKLVSFMQSRLGPMEAGPFGSLQLLAEVGKFLQKEDIFPRKADRFVFAAAPFVVLASTFLLVVVVPGGPDAWFIDSTRSASTSAMAVSSVSVIGILMAGWGSASKYSLLGGLRATGQLIAYELPLILAVIGVVIQAETMNMQGIVLAQAEGEIFGWGGLGNPYILTQFVAFLIFMIAMQAELTQTPFDMPIAESELVTGYMTEYSGMRFLLFFIGEFATAGVFSAIAAVLFLGGWYVPGIDFERQHHERPRPDRAHRARSWSSRSSSSGSGSPSPASVRISSRSWPGSSSSRSRSLNIVGHRDLQDRLLGITWDSYLDSSRASASPAARCCARSSPTGSRSRSRTRSRAPRPCSTRTRRKRRPPGPAA